MDATLVMVKEDGSSKEIPLDRDSIVIGRDEGARLRIPLPSVSRRHCELLMSKDDELVVKDLGSSNGTFVNGKKVRHQELSPGDLLAVGPVVFVVRISGHPKDIDAKDCYMAGVVGQDEGDDDDDGPARPPVAPPPPLSKPTAGAPARGKPPAPPSKDSLADLLKDLDLDDEDEQPRPRSM